MAELLFRGLIPAFPTPLAADGTLDEDGLARIVEFQIARGVSGLVPLGGTGEATSFDLATRRRIMEVTVSAAARRVPVIGGVLDPGRGGALDTARLCREAGADGLMVIAPYYARPDQEGVLRYFRSLAPELKLPVIYYDNPYRTHLVTAPETIARMEAEGLIVGMKASNTDLYHFAQVADRVSDRFCLLSGQDTLFVEQAMLGAKGGVLTSAALVPGRWAEILRLVEAGRVPEALALQRGLHPLMDALFAEQFPEGVRRAFAMIGLPIGASLPPVTALSQAAEHRLAAAIDALVADGTLIGAGV